MLAKELSNLFFTNWDDSIATANRYNQLMDMSADRIAELEDLAHQATMYQPLDVVKPSSYYYDKVSDLLNADSLVLQMNIDKKNCYYISMSCVMLVYTRCKSAYVETMKKLWYTYGVTPMHQKVLHIPKQKLYSALYFTNVIGYLPTKN